MDVIPQHLATRNQAEQRFRSAILRAFEDREGAFYTRYPIIPPNRRGRNEPDAVLLLPGTGAFLFEVKGCTLDQVRKVEGGMWIMQDWYSPYEEPLAQLDGNLHAFREAVLKPIGLDDAVPVIRRVVCPRIKRSVWVAEHSTMMERRMLFQDDLEAAPLRDNLAQHQTELSADQYTAIRSVMDSDVENFSREISRDGSIREVRYNGDPPRPDQILQIAGAESPEAFRKGSYTYVVATMSLDKDREEEGLAPSHQVTTQDPQNPGEERAQLLFRKYLRHELREADLPYSPAFLARLRLEESMEAVEAPEVHFEQLQRDVFEWEEVMADLHAKGIDLSDGIPSKIEDNLVNPSIGPVLKSLQSAFHTRLARENPTFTQQARRFLKHHFRPEQVVIMEGFSFLTPLQKLFIRQCVDLGATVILVHAYRDQQARGFAAMEGTYDLPLLEGVVPEDIETHLSSRDGDLDTLKKNLFSEQAGQKHPTFSNDGSVTLKEWAHVRDEVENVVRSIRQKLRHHAQDPQFDPFDVVVVSRDLETYRSRLVNEAELQAQEDDEENGIPSPLFHEPPRKLLLTPVGLFILTLFEVFRDGFSMSPEQFSTMMNSGLLDTAPQESVDTFEDITGQIFAYAETRKEWRRRLEQLERIIKTESRINRLPSTHVGLDEVEIWKEAFQKVCQLGDRLFDDKAHEVASLIRNLQDELSSVSDADMMKEELHLLTAIRDLLNELRDQAPQAKITMAQFGRVINSLIQEREDYEPDRAEERARREGRVVITGPEGLDGSKQKVTYYTGVDDRRVPRPYSRPWPYGQSNIQPHVEQERYLFLAVIRATTEELHLSYGRVDGTNRNRPSPYFNDVTEIWSGATISSPQNGGKSKEDGEQTETVESRDQADGFSPPPGKNYSLAQLMQAALCPYRYKMERLDRVAETYRTEWQLQFLFQGLTLRRIFEHMADANVVIPASSSDDREYIYNNFERALSEVWHCEDQCTKPDCCVRCMAPGFRQIEWTDIEEAVKARLHKLANFCATDRNFRLSIHHAEPTEIKVESNGERYTVGVEVNFVLRAGKIDYPLTADLVHQEWLLPRGENASNAAQSVFHEWSNIVRATYQYRHPSEVTRPEMMEKFRSRYRDVQDTLREYIQKVESIGFPKNHGSHCRYCSAQEECLGVVLPREG